MELQWAELKAEARALVAEIGASGRDHHSLARPGALLDAVRAQGVPPEHREWVWPILLHAHRQKLQRQLSNFATYSQLLEGVQEAEQEDDEDDASAADSAVEPLALDRSGLQQAHEMAMERFSHLNPFQERKIKRILLAYVKSRDGQFYYCHGMVEICAVLSTFLSEDDAFWAFRLLLEVLLPKYHEASIVDFQVDCLVLQDLLEQRDPVLSEHLAAVGVTIQVLCTKWFFSFFAESMPFELVCRLYDILLVDLACPRRLSAKILFSTASAVFLYLSEMLKEMQDPSVIVDVIGEFCLTTLSDYSVAESFVDLVLFLHEALPDPDVVALRQRFKVQLEEEARAVKLQDLPDEHRSWVWPVLLSTVPLPKHFPRDFPPSTPDDPTAQEKDADALEQEVIKAIENDVQRTRNITREQHDPMRRVLRAFARRNRRIGYCQGMNEILAVLLQYLPERDALLALSLLLEGVLPAYHVDSMIGLHTDCAVLHALLRQNDNELHTHLQQLGLNMEILCTKWLVTCFLTTLPSEAGLQILDWIMEEQLEDLADLYVRGRIDEKEHACIKQTIVRKWCKGMNSPQSAMSRVRQVKAKAEKYLVWCLMHLPDVDDASESVLPGSQAQSLAPPSYESSSGDRSEMLLTWQQRAEQQLRLLSMPMEPPSGHIHVMDSSRMMKRKGYLPSLPSSPPKTLTELMQHVQNHPQQIPPPSSSPGGRRNNGSCFTSFEVELGDVTFRTTALDLELLGSHDTPPHAIVTLVAASVLILLSPSDRIPKDLSWPSCQKMLRDGVKLLRRMQRSGTIEQVAANAPPFKWKALLPFTQNEHFEPYFLMEYSSAAATLCAWVLRVLRSALDMDSIASGADDDRRELLEVLEQDDDEAETQHDADAGEERSRDNEGGKRVKMGGAEVLFINENQPVSPPPWTHRGVTYFVTFFLERREGEEDQLSLKMYEPMSSVESQMFLTAEDLRMDFGRSAGEYFRRRDFGSLCDLILSQLDGMMLQSSLSTGSLGRLGSTSIIGTTDGFINHSESGDGTLSRSGSRRSSRERRVSFEPLLERSQEDEVAAAVRIQALARQNSAKKEVAKLRQQKREQRETEAVVTIQSLARQRNAKQEVERMRRERDATVRIQCAARQKQARNKVQRVRFAKETELIAQQTDSAVKIQSLARQRQAKKRVARLKLQRRQPTGLTKSLGDRDPDGYDDEDDDGGHEPQQRPETSASYASEQFEDDFETDE
ncbi:hypothetical protein ATCC90586_004862 [Pythium insidiosum]|nr:hypothetical protein ATCC90586_004862 [Pythium insidiosum]